MKGYYGVSINTANEDVFSCGLFKCVEYCKSILETPDAFELIEDEVEKLIELSKKYNVEVRSFHIPFGVNDLYPFEPASLDENARERTFEYTKRLIEIVSKAGIRYVVIHGSLRVLPEDRQARLDAFVGYVQKLCDFCKEYNIKVAVETLKPRCIGNGLKEHLYIMEHANRDNIGICFDSNHLLEEDNIAFLEGAGQYVLTTHFSDFDGIDERHWYPGRGINDWKKITEILKEKGYNGPAMFEVSFPVKPAKTEDLKELISEWEQIFD